jgi:hypothetical protein
MELLLDAADGSREWYSEQPDDANGGLLTHRLPGGVCVFFPIVSVLRILEENSTKPPEYLYAGFHGKRRPEHPPSRLPGDSSLDFASQAEIIATRGR